MNLLDWINQGISGLVATSSPSIDALGFRMFVALLTVMMVWFGVQEALSSAEGSHAFRISKFVEFVLIASFAYTLIEFYDSAIPAVGYSFKDFITLGANSLANMIGQDSINQMNQTITDMQSQLGSGILKAVMSEYYAIVMVLVQLLLGVFSATIAAIVAYGAIGAAVAALLGPIFIPFLLVEKLSFLFWGWLRAFIGFSFYKVVAAAVLAILGHLYTLFYTSLIPLDVSTIISKLPLLILLILVNLYILFKIPAITSSIFSGHTGGHGGGLGAIALAGRFV
jgi:type IV secretory pathway VirB6-like protein